ncbi:MAG: putative DNA binding domain-containing protein [Synergistaceae bacterium]|jgi:ATP-dependent DNA helicase RecG|nr:putative DNA binding domain-containing protein [Synergistaceae bacterium]
MDHDKLRNVLATGETVAVEFKKCSDGVHSDTYETVCSFLNRYGGDIYLGVEDDGSVSGVPRNTAPQIIKNFIKMVNNPEVISPTVYLAPEIVDYEEKTLIHIHVPPSSEVHSYKKTIYDRADDADVKITATGQIASMYIRKQNIFTEKRIYPYVKNEHLRLDILPRVQQMAVNRFQNHPWKSMDNERLFHSAGLYGEDMATGEKGYNLAAIMLFGRDEVIRSVVPAYRTDALVRKVNTDRYDDRLIVETNLLDSYEQLMVFAQNHLWDKFYLENDARISLRDVITREMLVNTLIHREFTHPYIAKFVIEKDRMFTENANRPLNNGVITPDDFEPNPKNPIISSFFRNIGLADELGSGVRNLYKYGRRYSGKEPQLIDGDVFRIIMPLDDAYSFDSGSGKVQLSQNIKGENCTLTEKAILDFLKDNTTAKQTDIANVVGKSLRTIKTEMALLREKGLLRREGTKRSGRWVVMEKLDAYSFDRGKVQSSWDV